MPTKFFIALLALTVAGLTSSNTATAQKKVHAYNYADVPAPKGMVYVPGGSIIIKYGDDSSAFKRFSLSAFFIDKYEVTNKQYRKFVEWVIDSVAVTEYLKDDKYFTDRNRDSSHKYINWRKMKRNNIWQNTDALQPMFASEGEIRKDLYQFNFKYLKKDKETGISTYATETVNIFPDTKVWAKDFPNSQTELLVNEYFTNPAYDDYPVVGVTWKQARAYAYWRTLTTDSKHLSFMGDFNLPYTLPSEAQWVHAAQALKGQVLSWDSTGALLKDKDNELIANFKQDEGIYNLDGSSYTVPVMSYAPNGFGIYNMLGNVAEWVLDAYNESAWAFVHDQNPVLLYDADESESDFMKRKVIRGGSWKDNASSLSPYSREYEIQDQPHSYVGFRCVMAAPEVLGKQVETRKR